MAEHAELYFDVIVVGGGNAAMCAALSAREKGARVLLMEKATPEDRGGNCPYTGGGFRFTHSGAEDLKPLLADPSSLDGLEGRISPYTTEDYRREMMERTAGRTDPELLSTLIAESYPTVLWMRGQGIEFELSGRGRQVMPGVRVGASGVGSGPGLIAMHYTAARRHGVEVVYETKMLRLLTDDSGGVIGVVAEDSEGVQEIRAGSVVLACGGFEASSEMRSEHLGGHWERAKVRGSKHNTGDGHRAALEIGANAAGQWTGYHGTPIDADAPDTGSPDSVDRLPRRSYPFGVMLKRNGERFVDEGADFALNNFVEMGALILKQPGGIVFQVFDAKAESLSGGAVRERVGSQGRIRWRVGGEAGAGFAAGGAYDWGVQRRCAGRGVRRFEAGRQGDQGGRAAQEQLGFGHRHAALFGVPGYGRNHLYLRRAEDKHAGAGVGHGGQADSRSLRCR